MASVLRKGSVIKDMSSQAMVIHHLAFLAFTKKNNSIKLMFKSCARCHI